MIKLSYQLNDEKNSLVEAEFNTFDEMEEFRKKMDSAERRRQHDADYAQRRERADHIKAVSAIRYELKSLLLRAKDNGMSPSDVVDLITSALSELVKDGDMAIDTRKSDFEEDDETLIDVTKNVED